MKFLLLILVLFLMFGGGYFGYRRDYYGRGGFSLLTGVIVVILAVPLFGGLLMGYMR